MANIVRRSPTMGDISRYDPFSNFEDLFRKSCMRPFSMEAEAPMIKVDITESDNAYKVRAEIPGVKKEDVKVQVEGNRVTISCETRQETEEKEGERVISRECHQGSSYRSFMLGSEVDETKAGAKYEAGMLELRCRRKKEQAPGGLRSSSTRNPRSGTGLPAGDHLFPPGQVYRCLRASSADSIACRFKAESS